MGLFGTERRKRMRDLIEVLGRLASGDYEARARSLDRSEDGEVGAAVNKLAEHMEAAVRELSQDRAQLASVLENMVEGVVAVDASGHVLLVNTALAELFAIDAVAAKGRPFLEVLRHVQINRLLTAVLADGATHEEEITVFAAREERKFEANAGPLTLRGAPAGALIVLHDITRIRRLEQVRRDFVANVSHELRTPLTSIKGFAEILRAGAMDDKERREEFVETIEKHADRLTRLVDDLLDLAAIESGKKPPAPEPLSIKEAAEEAAGGLRGLAAGRGVNLAFSGLEDLPKVSADRGQLQQVFLNLLNNAVKFNHEGGTVTVSGSSAEGEVTVAVADNGPGIPAEDLPRIFERFYRVDKARSQELGGTGLGLAIVKHIIEAHGGRVSVESTLGKGATFRFTLPQA